MESNHSYQYLTLFVYQLMLVYLCTQLTLRTRQSIIEWVYINHGMDPFKIKKKRYESVIRLFEKLCSLEHIALSKPAHNVKETKNRDSINFFSIERKKCVTYSTTGTTNMSMYIAQCILCTGRRAIINSVRLIRGCQNYRLQGRKLSKVSINYMCAYRIM
jgi:hypothetical protein